MAKKSAAAPPTPLRKNNLLEAAQARLEERKRLEEESRLASQPCVDEYNKLHHQALAASARAERIRGSIIPADSDNRRIQREAQEEALDCQRRMADLNIKMPSLDPLEPVRETQSPNNSNTSGSPSNPQTSYGGSAVIEWVNGVLITAPWMCASNKPLQPATGSGSNRRCYTFRLEKYQLQRSHGSKIRGCFTSPCATCKWN